VTAAGYFLPDPAAERTASRSWWRAILTYGPLCWLSVFVVELLNMEAWRIANTEAQVAPPVMRALQFLLLLPPLLLACRVAIVLGSKRYHLGLRAAGQLALCAVFAALARPALATAAWILGQSESASVLAASILSPSRESIAVWIASGAATALNYAVCLCIIVGVETYRDLENERVARAEVEREATQARLQALTNQLNPHFLFNVLNTIVSLIESRPRLAQTLVTRFADLLRQILSDGATQFVSLGRELELLEQYVQIQEMRFPLRLSHATRVAPGVAEALVPPLIMQPIIENAVLHGLRSDGDRVHVMIDARAADGVLEIHVSNPGRVTAAGDPAVVPGIGLRNVTERLRTLFGGQAAVILKVPSPGHYLAIVRMPLLEGSIASGTAAA
jgi:hypothetical protein